jgi:hypothetical protein
MKALAEICAARKSTTDMRVVVNETEEGLAFDGGPWTNPAPGGGLGTPLVPWRGGIKALVAVKRVIDYNVW